MPKAPWYTPAIVRNKDGSLMKPGDFVVREGKEWGQAFGQFGKELFGFTTKQLPTEAEKAAMEAIRELMKRR